MKLIDTINMYKMLLILNLHVNFILYFKVNMKLHNDCTCKSKSLMISVTFGSIHLNKLIYARSPKIFSSPVVRKNQLHNCIFL